MSGGYYESALLRLRRVTAYLNLRYTAVVKEHKLTPVQFEILLYVACNAPCTVTDIADFMVVDKSTSSRALRGVEDRNLIQISLDQTDRRKRNITLTQTGESVVRGMQDAWFQVEKDVREKYDTAIEHLEYA
jgi:DNA-binding MarR family transcriptional regulator